MANLTGSNPMVIDTPGTAVIYADPIDVANFAFVGYSAAAHIVVVQDGSGNLKWQSRGASDLTPVRSGLVKTIYGLKVPTLDSGKLLVYFD